MTLEYVKEHIVDVVLLDETMPALLVWKPGEDKGDQPAIAGSVDHQK